MGRGNTQEQTYPLYVFNLPPHCTDTALRQRFSRHGEVRKVDIVHKITDHPIGFVHFTNAKDAAKALVSENRTTLGQHVLKIRTTKDWRKAQHIEYFALRLEDENCASKTTLSHNSNNRRIRAHAHYHH